MNSLGIRNILLVACLVLGAAMASAQSFHVTLGDTIASGPLGMEIIFEVDVKNVSSGALTLAFVRTTNSLPSGWQSALCVNQSCYASSLDSIALTTDFGCAPLRSGDSTNFSVHVTPQISHGTGTVRIVVMDVNNCADSRSMQFITIATANSAPLDGNRPATFVLCQNYPNPWNPSTRIRYTIVEADWVCLTLNDLLGRPVATLVRERQSPGTYEVEVSKSLASAGDLPSGTYLYRMESGGVRQTRRMVLVK